MVIRMRHTKGHTRNRRSHHGLDKQALSSCSKCKQDKLPHTACRNCGTYKNKEVIDVLKKLTKKERKQKEKELKEQESHDHTTKSLDAAQLSKK